MGILLWKEGAAGSELFRGNPGRATLRACAGIFSRCVGDGSDASRVKMAIYIEGMIQTQTAIRADVYYPRVSQAKTDGLVDFAGVLASYGDARSGDGHLAKHRRSFGPPFRKIPCRTH